MAAGTGSEASGKAPSAADIKVAAKKGGKAVAKKVSEAAAGLKDQATERARDIATQGKDKATAALDSVTRLVDEAAGTIDTKVGEQYGAYARRAAEAVQGFTATLRSKEVDELLRDARDAVKKNPAIAIGAAAALGFFLARVMKAGSAPAEAEEPASPPRTGKAPKGQSKPAA
jgi:hypothetical protein